MDETVETESLGPRDLLVPQERKEILDLRDLRGPAVEESHTSGGVTPPAPTHLEPN